MLLKSCDNFNFRNNLCCQIVIFPINWPKMSKIKFNAIFVINRVLPALFFLSDSLTWWNIYYETTWKPTLVIKNVESHFFFKFLWHSQKIWTNTEICKKWNNYVCIIKVMRLPVALKPWYFALTLKAHSFSFKSRLVKMHL